MKKFFSMLSLAAVMLVAMFAATPQVAQASNVEVQSIKCNAASQTIELVLKFINDEDYSRQWWGVDVRLFDIIDPNQNTVFTSGNFTINVDTAGDFIVAPHSERTWNVIMKKNGTAGGHVAISPEMETVPDIIYDWNAGWRFSWDCRQRTAIIR